MSQSVTNGGDAETSLVTDVSLTLAAGEHANTTSYQRLSGQSVDRSLNLEKLVTLSVSS
jgi:hypothetical protein